MDKYNLDTLKIRPVEAGDISAIEKLVANEWYQNWTAKDPIASAADVYFDVQSCLNNSSFGQVALVDDQVVGVIMVRADKDIRHLRLLTTDSYDQVMVLLSRPKDIQEELARDHKREKEVNDQLLVDTGINYQGEVVLFLLAPSARGLGIGSKLFQLANDYFQSQNVNRYFLFTDDACTVSFYQKAGLRENGARNINPDGTAPFYYYLYDNLK